jgi:mRNA-degrading endonuclease YafQ of YafQ-DinJ toxin-antitoxin module
MSVEIIRQTRFKKDVKQMKRQNRDFARFKEVLENLPRNHLWKPSIRIMP